jgi:hypothetical protein
VATPALEFSALQVLLRNEVFAQEKPYSRAGILSKNKIAGDFRLKKPRFHAAVVSSYRGLMVIGGKTSSTEILV